jgi:hypothetical protein
MKILYSLSRRTTMKTAFAIALLAFATSAFALAQLTGTSRNAAGHTLCHYSDGTVDNIGFSYYCPPFKN